MKTTDVTTAKVLFKAIISVLFILIIGLRSLSAQDYVLNLSDPSTYFITCGRVNAGQWSVKNDTCMLFTPYLEVMNAEGSTVSFIFNVNQSGNGDQYDKGYVYRSVDGNDWVLDQTWTAGGAPAVYTFSTSVFLEQYHFVQFMVKLSTNNKTEFWAILDGNISATDNDNANHNVVAFANQPKDPNEFPVELISFTGKSDQGMNILEWKTATETNNDYFVIERSEDGEEFHEIGRVTGAGNSNSLLEYEYSDIDPIATAYYRLKQVDFDGNYEYSAVLRLSENNDGTVEMNIFSSASEVIITANSEESLNTVVNIYTSAGQIVYSTNVSIPDGASYSTFSPDIDLKGLYILSVSNDEMVFKTAKIIF